MEVGLSFEEVFGLPEDKPERFAQIREDAILQTRTQIANGDGLEFAVMNGARTVQQFHSLDDDTTKRVVRELFKEFLGRDKADIEAEVEVFWERSRAEFLANLPEYQKMAAVVVGEVDDDKEK